MFSGLRHQVEIVCVVGFDVANRTFTYIDCFEEE